VVNSVTFSNPGSSLTINVESAGDVVNFSSVNASYGAALAINGNAGNQTVNLNASLNLASGNNLAVNLQNATAVAGVDTSKIGPSAHLHLSGSGAATLISSGNIVLASGSSIATVNGDLSIEANQQAVPTAGDFIGVDVENALIEATGTGQVTVFGTGGDDSG